MRIAIVGLGLIGGSIARALRAADREHVAWASARLVGWSPGGEGPDAALAAGVIDAVATSLDDAATDADLVILAAPPAACLAHLETLDGLRGRLAPGAVVTDVASTKATIGHAAERLGLPFVGGHPMAGRETSGFHAASPDLFRGRPWVVVPSGSAPAGGLERVEALAVACGARPIRLDADVHDRAVAGISHLPLVLATALVEAVIGGPGGPDRKDWPDARELAATGWTGMTRLARGSPEMAADIAATNGPAIVARLRDVRERLDDWIALLDGDPGTTALRDRFEAARDRLARPDGPE